MPSMAAYNIADLQRAARLLQSAPLPLYALVVFACRWPAILVPLGLDL